jgi:hypothetical protein
MRRVTDLAGIDLARLADVALAAEWRAARPFPHVVVDGLVTEEARGTLIEALADEPASVIRDEIFEMMASAVTVEDARLRRFHAALESAEVLAAIEALSGKRVKRADMRAFAYEAGHYLLPHTDHQEDVGRAVAYAFYLDATPDLEGGELALFETATVGGEIVEARESKVIAPRANRLVLFEVSPASLHEVREVTRGMRLSLAGWFYP